MANEYNQELFKHKIKAKVLNKKEIDFQKVKIHQNSHLMKMPSMKVLNKYMGTPLLYPKKAHFIADKEPMVQEDLEKYSLQQECFHEYRQTPASFYDPQLELQNYKNLWEIEKFDQLKQLQFDYAELMKE